MRTCPLADKRAIVKRFCELAQELDATLTSDGTDQSNLSLAFQTRGGLYTATLYAEDGKEYLSRRVNPRDPVACWTLPRASQSRRRVRPDREPPQW